MDQESPVHEIVSTLWAALHALGARSETSDVERWAFSIHGALSAPGREYHNHEHVMWMALDGDPLARIAALYHDSVYIQVDHGSPPSMAAELATVLDKTWRVLPAAADREVTADVLAIFGRRVGDVVTPTTGLNELASALVAAIQLADVLDRKQRIAIAACIEHTIPFRVGAVDELRDRLIAIGLGGAGLDEVLERAVRLGNRDVESFGDTDPGRFLDNTWKLLPESNPALHSPQAVTVRDYRIALQKMEHFLGWLPADRVFHSYGNETTSEHHAQRIARTKSNLLLAGRYLRAKLYSIALVEAIAELTGGDVPLDFFMGGMQAIAQPGAPKRAKRIEHFLPQPQAAPSLDPFLHRLLAEGRASESRFDTQPSPLGAFLHSTLGEATMLEGVEQAKRWWAGAGDAAEFLATQPAAPIAAICRAAAQIMKTRRDRLIALAERFEDTLARTP